jgi:hypothetical protein
VGSYEPRRDQRAVERRVERRRRTRRLSAGVVALGVFAATGWLTWTAFRPGGSTLGSTGSGTYLLSGFEVGPHVDPVTGEVVPGPADVTFTTRWSSDEYPGVHQCELRVLGAASSEIGSLSFEMSALSQGRFHAMAVPVTGSIDGATATGSCDLERLDLPVAYVISNERLEYGDGRLSIVYEVAVPEGVPEGQEVGAQACTSAVWNENGGLLGKGHFTLSGAPEGMQDAGVGHDDETSMSEAAQATVNCVPYVHENEFPDPKRPITTSPQAAAMVLVPDVMGLSEGEAVARLEGLGLKVSVTTELSDEVAEGIVAVQDPSAGAGVDAGMTVTIQVSEGPVARCVQATTSGDFDGDGTTDDAEFVEVVSGSVSCDRGGQVFENLSSQELKVGLGSGRTLKEPFADCQGGLCAYVFAAADLDGDGRDELAIDVSSGGSSGLVELYRVDPDGIRPLVIAEPGDPSYVQPGPAILGGGFDSGLQSPVVCRVNDDGTRELVSIHAENVGDSLSGPWEVHTTAMALRGEELVVTSASDSRSSFPGTSGIPSFSGTSPFENGCS